MCKYISGHQGGSDRNVHETQVDCTDRCFQSSSKIKQNNNNNKALHQFYRTITKYQSSESVRQVSEPFPWRAGECSEGMLGEDSHTPLFPTSYGALCLQPAQTLQASSKGFFQLSPELVDAFQLHLQGVVSGGAGRTRGAEGRGLEGLQPAHPALRAPSQDSPAGSPGSSATSRLTSSLPTAQPPPKKAPARGSESQLSCSTLPSTPLMCCLAIR